MDVQKVLIKSLRKSYYLMKSLCSFGKSRINYRLGSMTKFIEIGITILVDIFKGIKKHCEKKNPTGIMNIKIQRIPLPPREMWNVFSSYHDPNLRSQISRKTALYPFLLVSLGYL